MDRRHFFISGISLVAAWPGWASEHDALPKAIQKFNTDAGARKAMLAIRAIVLKHHTLITHRRISSDGARRFAEDVQALVDSALPGLAIEGEARERLKRILAEIEQGASAIARAPASTEAIEGMLQIDAALARYGEHFEDTEWKPLR